MRLRPWLPWLVLLALAVTTAVGLHLTRDESASAALSERPGAQAGQAAGAPGGLAPGAPRGPDRLVDMEPLLTARRVAALARTPEEQELARQAKQLADHAVDLALADSIRRIAEDSPEPTPEQKALAVAKQKAQAALAAAQTRLEALSARIATSPPEERDRLADQRDLADADKELAQDELDEAAERLARAGGDPQARIQRLRAAFQAAQVEEPGSSESKSTSVAQTGVARALPSLSTAAIIDSTSGDSLLVRVRLWSALRKKQALVEDARREALERGQRLTARSDRIRERVKAAEATTAEARRAGSGLDAAAKQVAITAMRSAAQSQRRLAAIGARRQDQQELAEVYGDWVALADHQIRIAGHQALSSLAWLLGASAVVFGLAALVGRLFRSDGERRVRLGPIRSVVKLAIEVAGMTAVVLVALGMPIEATTVLGLAGAGLTVALKDFIVAFVGWFVLMGKDGIRVGDWVEIKGVAGEVAEIGILRTVLLETGGRAVAGHPTGRRVSFVNSFAIEGHFFNFSTSGQWMWDELKAAIPSGKDPYPIIDQVQRLVEREVQANAAQAEQDWQKSGNRYRAHAFSAVPSVAVVPASGGVELEVRYVTRAHERQAVRQRLNQAVVEILHGPRAAGTPPANATL